VHRRLAGLAASVLLLNLNVVGVERACGSRHDVQKNSHEHMGHSGQHSPAPAHHDAPSKCCDALSSCGMTLSFGAETFETRSFDTAVIASDIAIGGPRSVLRAPEPPPPKA